GVVERTCGKVGAVGRVVTGIRVVRGNVGGVRGDGHRGAEHDLLPAGRRFAGEGRGCQQRARVRPEVPDVRAGVRIAPVVAKPGDVAIGVGLELHAEFTAAAVPGVDEARGDG